MSPTMRIALTVLLLLPVRALLAQDMGGSMFDQDWDKTHPYVPPPAPSEAPAPIPGTRPSVQAPEVRTPTPETHAIVRVGVPDAAAQKQAEMLVNEVFARAIAQATTPKAKTALAQSLLSAAVSTHRNLTARFVACRMARDIAADAGQSALAFQAISTMAQTHDIDAAAMKMELIVRLLKNADTPARQAMIPLVQEAVNDAVAVDRDELAFRLNEMASSLADRVHDHAAMDATAARAGELREAQTAYTAVKPLLAVAGTQPANAAADLAVGKYKCFCKGDWEGGLPLLARAADIQLKAMAMADLVGPTDAADQAALADRWWMMAEKQPAGVQRQLRLHAVGWYQKTQGHLSGPAQTAAADRIQQMAPKPAEAADPHRVVAIWAVRWDGGHTTWFLRADGTTTDGTDPRKLPGAWSRDGKTLVVRSGRGADAWFADGVVIHTLVVSDDGHSFAGTNQLGGQLWGKLVEPGDNGAVAETPMTQTIRIAVTVLLLLSVRALLAQDMGGSIFDLEWDKKHPQPSTPAQSEAPAAIPGTRPTSPTPETRAPSPQTPILEPQPVVRVGVPNAAAQKQSETLVRDVFADAIGQAVSPETKTALAQTLLHTAINTHRDLTARFVLCRMARDLAADNGQAAIALQAITTMAQTHHVDALMMKRETIIRLMKNADAAARQTLIPLVQETVNDAVAADRYDDALRLNDLASSLADRINDKAAMEATAARARELKEAQAAYTAIQPLLARAATQPADPAACLAIGKYKCFYKGDWDGGLPLLAQAGDHELKGLAAQEVAGPTDADAQAALADAWWLLAEKEPATVQRQIRVHAVGWYRQAQDHLTGLAQALAAKRIEQMTPKIKAPADAAPPGTAIDLLAMVDPDKDAVGGHWAKAGGALSGDGGEFTRLCLPYDPPDEYDIHVEFARMTGVYSVNLLLCTPTNAFTLGLSLGDGHDRGAFTAWNGTESWENSTTFTHPVLQNGKRYSVIVQVRKAELTAYLDGKMVSHYAGDLTGLQRGERWDIGQHRIGLGTWDAATTFYVVELTEISGHGKPLRN